MQETNPHQQHLIMFLHFTVTLIQVKNMEGRILIKQKLIAVTIILSFTHYMVFMDK